ncbi:MAG TPA: RNA 2'-phosphotransferase [Ohtaekwangia sp.]|uniref:RNA 2'-phosphotransferase n=1 Tax=Ohtaekwangia sp. TaxID=2066019 RepID=UPI002F93CEEE
MISEKESVKISKFLSLILRHQPEAAGIVLDENGWTEVSILIQQVSAHGHSITKETLDYIVHTNSKKRFAYNEDQTKIRASQGHSVDVELNYTSQQPPAILYHGTAETSVESIFKTGLDKRERHHVHMSISTETALAVGSRYGKPVLLAIAAGQMFTDGHSFFVSDNDVWLTDHVPLKYLSIVKAV